MRYLFYSLIIVLSTLALSLHSAELSVASPFTDHMVLQRDMPVPVWGKATSESVVTVNFGGQTISTKADSSGNWALRLKPLTGTLEGLPFEVQSGNSSLTFTDVVVGEVWICSGQSNMQMGRNSVKEFNEVKEVNLRSFEVKRTVAFTEQETLEGSWEVAGPNSAVAFGFSHFLSKHVDVPVGIILSAWGSSSIEAWMPRDMIKTLPHFKTIMDEWDANKEAQEAIKTALAKDKWTGKEDVFMRRQSNIVYNAMMKPLAPYACRGLVWYQGERNTRFMSGMPESPWYMRVAGIQEYDETLKAWIERYRQEWQRPDLHFLLVMLPGYGQILKTGPTMEPNHPASHSWAWMRESQMGALDLPHVGVANTIDLGDVKNIHPKDKLPIGQRLALLAAKDTVDKNVVSRGPMLNKVEKKAGQLVMHFDHAEGLRTTDGETPTEFWLWDSAGENWVPAKATITDQSIVLRADGIKAPAFARYAFTGKPNVNLVNGAGLPAYPFRTDSFEP